jgi:hypothetical protein
LKNFGKQFIVIIIIGLVCEGRTGGVSGSGEGEGKRRGY